MRSLAEPGHHEVLGLGHQQLDVCDRDATMAAITTFAPDAIIHAAAWTDVDGCEGDPERAFRANALATRNVVEAARIAGARVTYISTDYVFDGTKADPYHEWDGTGPLSVYGRSKLAGERELDPSSLVIRTSWLFGTGGGSFVKTVLRLAREERPLRFVDDQRGHPTNAADLAPAVVRLTAARWSGVVHVTNQGPATWFELARDVLTAGGFDAARAEPITTSELEPSRPAPRPTSSVLDNAVLRLRGEVLLPHYRDTLEPLVKELLSP
jgi:dTDP-4-dehydrorhamnose reductase